MPSSPESDQGATATTEDLAARNAELEDRHLRALADLENYRKRSARETERRVAEERDRLLREWLEAVDSVERALRMTPDAEGLQAVLEQMEAILARQGVARAGAPGDRFDPERHEAIGVSAARVPRRRSPTSPGPGYTIGDRVLRPAQVIVTRS